MQISALQMVSKFMYRLQHAASPFKHLYSSIKAEQSCIRLPPSVPDIGTIISRVSAPPDGHHAPFLTSPDWVYGQGCHLLEALGLACCSPSTPYLACICLSSSSLSLVLTCRLRNIHWSFAKIDASPVHPQEDSDYRYNTRPESPQLLSVVDALLEITSTQWRALKAFTAIGGQLRPHSLRGLNC